MNQRAAQNRHRLRDPYEKEKGISGVRSIVKESGKECAGKVLSQ